MDRGKTESLEEVQVYAPLLGGQPTKSNKFFQLTRAFILGGSKLFSVGSLGIFLWILDYALTSWKQMEFINTFVGIFFFLSGGVIESLLTLKATPERKYIAIWNAINQAIDAFFLKWLFVRRFLFQSLCNDSSCSPSIVYYLIPCSPAFLFIAYFSYKSEYKKYCQVLAPNPASEDDNKKNCRTKTAKCLKPIASFFSSIVFDTVLAGIAFSGFLISYLVINNVKLDKVLQYALEGGIVLGALLFSILVHFKFNNTRMQKILFSSNELCTAMYLNFMALLGGLGGWLLYDYPIVSSVICFCVSLFFSGLRVHDESVLSQR